MRIFPAPAISGLIVMAAGIATLAGMSARADSSIELSPETLSAQDSVPGEESAATPPGIDAAVQRTLGRYGLILNLDPDQQNALEPAIARVLAEFVGTLTVPLGQGTSP